MIGQYLKVDDGQKQDPKGKILVAINHIRIDAIITSWEKDHVTFNLPEGKLPGLEKDTGLIWISLIVDGVETNAVPFEVTKLRSGSWAMAHLNHSGAGGSSPLNGASGARTQPWAASAES